MATSDPLIVRAYLMRGAVLWLLARILISVVLTAANSNPFALSVRSSVIIILIATALSCVQTARLRESVLLGNLGVSRPELAAYFAVPALVGELLISATAALFA